MQQNSTVKKLRRQTARNESKQDTFIQICVKEEGNNEERNDNKGTVPESSLANIFKQKF